MLFGAFLPVEHIRYCPGHTFFRMFAAEIASDLRVRGHSELRTESEVHKRAPRIGRKAFGREAEIRGVHVEFAWFSWCLCSETTVLARKTPLRRRARSV